VLQEGAHEVGNMVQVITIDVDTNPELATHYQIRGVPSTMMFKNGKTTFRPSDVISKAQLVEMMRKKP
jgi:thioredoxin 1